MASIATVAAVIQWSIATELGIVQVRSQRDAAAGVSVSKYVVTNWYRDGASNGMAFDDEALNASVPRNRYELNAGARVDFRSGLSAWGGFGVMRGDHGYREATANLSMSYKW
ncbi:MULTISPECIES: autotransporter outer membrane beta-barrel domain-containing protein [Stenotrophomonas]|uniref:autotransporter outer membrane beta-barrel domain-containing protein n=1 Tax=Stenotrophomonas TaxID=40323 RepID=UPI001F2EDFEC|nr:MULTISPECIES: autotransporter outer membrane beta-barrel domain-containing protein [Stenotrophomonas]